jgi:predicted AAA+ superfamily ATPase
MPKEYFPRVVDALLGDYLEAFGAVRIRGPKWCGKTTTAEQRAKSVLKMQDPDRAGEYRRLADFLPSRLLKGEIPRLIDEWQTAPVLWDAVRTAVDARGEPGQFILTGSSVLDTDATMHTGTGRIATLSMYPMSLFESKESNGAVSLKDLFEAPERFEGARSPLTVQGLAHAICRGGWPASIHRTAAASLLISRSYVDSICESDASRVDGVTRRPLRVRALLRSYARNLSTLAANTTILADVKANDEEMTEPTLYSYLAALRRLYVIDDVPAWSPSIRSARTMRATSKKEFVDPSIATAALGLSPDALLGDPETLGFVFECLCIRDLRVLSTSFGGTVSYYHDRTGLECDAVLHRDDGAFALIEMKLGNREIEEGASHLLRLASLLQENGRREPAFMMVLTGGEYGFRTKDGVLVVPIGCLRD